MQRYKEQGQRMLGLIDSWTPMHKHRLLEASVVMLDTLKKKDNWATRAQCDPSAAVYIAVRALRLALACRIDAPDLGKVHCRSPTGIPG